MPIRQAGPDDAPALASLRRRMHEEDVGPVDDEAFAARFEAFWRQSYTTGRWVVTVATDDRHLVGHVWLQLVPRVPRPDEGEPGPIGYVTNVYVIPERRNAGIGSRLLAATIDAARDRGAVSLIVWPSERSVALYRRAGFEPGHDILEWRRPIALSSSPVSPLAARL
jgi:GNAT superfamily N-acetyltransferase